MSGCGGEGLLYCVWLLMWVGGDLPMVLVMLVWLFAWVGGALPVVLCCVDL